jgi:hypothetical protein
MIKLEYYDGAKWCQAGDFITEKWAWVSLGGDDENYRTVDENGKVLTDKSRNTPEAEPVKPYGLYGCSCHPFENWDECKAAHAKRYNNGDAIRQRCTGLTGTIKNPEKGGNYYYVETLGLVHAAEIESINTEA